MRPVVVLGRISVLQRLCTIPSPKRAFGLKPLRDNLFHSYSVFMAMKIQVNFYKLKILNNKFVFSVFF